MDRRAAVENEGHGDIQWGRKDMPDIEQDDLPGAGGREHPPPAKSPGQRLMMRRLLSLDFVSGASGHELAPC